MPENDGGAYYSDRLAADRLRRCYELAPPRVRRFLEAEIAFVRERIAPGDRVLDLGCGYGRVTEALAPAGAVLVGIDTSLASVRLGRDELARLPGLHFVCMDAARLGLRPGAFDLVICVQNGISAFHVDPRALMEEAVAAARPGGTVLFSSYADGFWDDRLEWFRIQAAAGLLGAIDEDATGDGEIVCEDGFRATTVRPDRFRELAEGLGRSVRIHLVDGSSVFCEIVA